MSAQQIPALQPLPGEHNLPHTFGPPMETEQHRFAMNTLIESLNLYWARRQDFYAGGNMALYFSASQVQNNDFVGPDFFVVLDTERRRRKSWVVWEELRTPDVVVELLSKTTEKRDRGEKMQIYARVLKVPEYYLFDPLDGRFEGYRLDLRSLVYAAVPPRPDGTIFSSRLGLRLAVESLGDEEVPAFQLRWVDPHGRVLPTPMERAEQERQRADDAQQRAEDEHQRAEDEHQRAEEAERRAARLEALLRKAGIEEAE